MFHVKQMSGAKAPFFVSRETIVKKWSKGLTLRCIELIIIMYNGKEVKHTEARNHNFCKSKGRRR